MESKTIAVLEQYKKEITIILITHSLNFIDHFDQVVILQKEKNILKPYVVHNPQRKNIVSKLLE